MSVAMDSLSAAFGDAFGAERIRRDWPLAPLTTFKVGGAADLFFEPRSSVEMLAALRLADDHGSAVTLLGGGSNVLVSDGGVRGVVLRPRGGTIAREDATRVRADAGVTVNGLVRWLIGHGLAGLEAWAGTPGTVGGAIYGNAHWAGRLMSDFVVEARLATRQAQPKDVPAAEMEFGYDRSRLQWSGEVLLSAVFAVSSGDPGQLRETARASLAYRKQTQPLAAPSAGCIFQNPPADTRLPDGIPPSAGALIDRAGLKGLQVGGALVSPTHANFIVNTGNATARDIRTVIERCRSAVRETFGVGLLDEIVYLGDWNHDKGDARVDVAD